MQDILDRDVHVFEAVLLDPKVQPFLERIEKSSPQGNRWEAYEQYKREAQTIMDNSYARKLQSPRYYTSMMEAIDALLPDEFACNQDDMRTQEDEQ